MTKYKYLTIILVCLTVLSIIPLDFAENNNNTIYVSVDGNDTNDGLTEATSKKTIKNSLKHVNPGGTIYIKPGTYNETLTIDKHVQLIGEDPTTTILDGNYKNTCITISPLKRVLIQGLTITHGESWIRGGGIYNDQSKVTLKNCIIQNNRAYMEFTSEGGGIYSTYGLMVIENSTIQNNIGMEWGGGIRSYYSVLTINDSIIQNNRGHKGGGGLSFGGGSLVIENSIIQNNSAEYGGGININSAQLAIENCIFKDNNASLVGRDIYSISTLIDLDDKTQSWYNNTLVRLDIF